MIKSFSKRLIAITLIGCMSLSLALFSGDSINASKKSKLTVKLNKKNITLKIGDSLKLKAKKNPAKAKLKWKSSKKSIATVSSKGTIKAKKAGKAVITVTATYKKLKKKASCKVKVNPKSVTVQTPQPTVAPTQIPTVTPATPAAKTITAITVSNDTISMNCKETKNAGITITPADATLADCKITSSKGYIANLDNSGVIKADYIGTTYIKIESLSNPSVNATIRVDVSDEFNPPEGFDVYNENIAHGELTDFNYPSDYRPGGNGHALIWFPPGYDESKEYNLLFCLHGGSDTEYYWTGDKGGGNDGCKGDIVLDNLYATGQMEDTIVVFPHGVIQYDESKDYPNVVDNPFLHINNDFWINHYLLEFDIVNNLLPYMVNHYPVKDSPSNRAICGLSMGCAQSMEIGFKHPDLFDYVGLFSAGPFEEQDQFFVTSTEDADKLNEQLKLVFFITGETDHLHDDSLRNFIGTCNDYGLNNVFYEVMGLGHDDYCWDKALYTFMRFAFK